jgi:thiamine-monophosphate kinase
MPKLRGEDGLLAWLRAKSGEPLLGDDAAVLPADGPFAVTVDSQIAGVHFVPDLDPAHLARRLLAVNLSDLAAMGAAPAYAFLALAAAPGFDHRRFFRSLLAACRAYRLRLAGGDLAQSPQATIATLTLLGKKPARSRWLCRDGAVPGHGVWLGGTVGESAAGRLLIARGARLRQGSVALPAAAALPSPLAAAARRAVRRHLLPRPQLELGEWLGRQREGAAIDVSDGVARDLHRLCRESGIGAEIFAEALPVSARFPPLCAALAIDPLALCLGGGEDYVLLFTLPPGREPPPRFGCRRIGVTTGRKTLMLRAGGGRRPLPDMGWDHLEEA